MHGDLRSEILREMIVVDGHLNGHVGTNGLDYFSNRDMAWLFLLNYQFVGTTLFCFAIEYSSMNLFYIFGRPLVKRVRPMLSDHCPVCLFVLSLTLVYCGQTDGSR